VRYSHRALVVASAVGLVVVGLLAVFATEVDHPAPTAANPRLGKAAPQISGRDLLTGGPERLSAMRGRYVLISFFASWCQPCNAEAPQLESFIFDHRKNVEVLGVVFDDSAQAATAFLRHYGATWPAVMDPSTSDAVAYGVAEPPQSFLISPAGRVLAWFPGAVTLTSLDGALDKAEATGA
jgi:cytochrome c biogenesis protein CcmG/thiol:disulfide interchange protein DsbE